MRAWQETPQHWGRTCPPNTTWVTPGAISCHHQGSPPPNVIWQKGGIPTKGRETITKGKNHSQFLINSTKRSDSGVYRILLQNEFGEAHYDIHVRVAGMAVAEASGSLPAQSPKYSSLCACFPTTAKSCLQEVKASLVPQRLYLPLP